MGDARPSSSGWFPSASRPGELQFFDGEQWQEHFAPVAGAAPPEAPLGRRRRYEAIVPEERPITWRLAVGCLAAIGVLALALALAGVPGSFLGPLVGFALVLTPFQLIWARRLGSIRRGRGQGPFEP